MSVEGGSDGGARSSAQRARAAGGVLYLASRCRARAVGMDNHNGRSAPSWDADLLWFDGVAHGGGTLVGGERASYRPDSGAKTARSFAIRGRLAAQGRALHLLLVSFRSPRARIVEVQRDRHLQTVRESAVDALLRHPPQVSQQCEHVQVEVTDRLWRR